MPIHRPLLVIGTRPEAIKMAPVALACRARPGHFSPTLCFTGQHGDLATAAAVHFGLAPDVDLVAMRPGQSLSSLLAAILTGLDDTIARLAPTCVVAQGDTTSVLAASLAAFYRRIPFVHVEAGLRTGDFDHPFPEELHRRAADLTAAVRCAPTRRAADALLAEGADPATVHLTGNTVVDALRHTLANDRKPAPIHSNLVLVTAHRRENFGPPMTRIADAVAALAALFPTHTFLVPLHPNPAAGPVLRARLNNLPNVRLEPSMDYAPFVHAVAQSALVLTDSGGLQEEAVSLTKPVLVLRETTERPEGIDAGLAELVGTVPAKIIERATALLNSPHARPTPTPNPYGDGHAAQRIADLILTLPTD